MINLEDAVKFIENINNAKLFDYQIKLLDNIIHGKITDCPRGMGKTFIIQSYAKYLNYVHDMCKHDVSIDIDDYISGEDVLKAIPSLYSKELIQQAFNNNTEKARTEYNIDFDSPYLIHDELAFNNETNKI